MKLNKTIIGLSLLFAGNNVVAADPFTVIAISSGVMYISKIMNSAGRNKAGHRPHCPDYVPDSPRRESPQSISQPAGMTVGKAVENVARAGAVAAIVALNPVSGEAAAKTFGENAGQDTYDLIAGLGRTTARATAIKFGQLAGQDAYDKVSGKAEENKAEREKVWDYEDNKATRENISIDQRDEDMALRREEIKQRSYIHCEQIEKHSEGVQKHQDRMNFPERFGGVQGPNSHFLDKMSSSFIGEHKE